MIKMRNDDQALSVQEIQDAEKELDVVFPADYKQFLLLHNGGQPDQKNYDFAENENGSDVHCFLSINGDDSISLLNEACFFQDKIPKAFIPIAYDSGNNQICLGVREPYYNQVYFWDFNEAPGWMDPEFYELPTFDNMYLLARSFDDCDELRLWYAVPSQKKKYCRKILADGTVIDSEEDITEGSSAGFQGFGACSHQGNRLENMYRYKLNLMLADGV